LCNDKTLPPFSLKKNKQTKHNKQSKEKQQKNKKTRIMQLTVLVVQHLHNKLVPFEATFLVYQTIQKRVGRR
jgi:hypothetical protein